MFEHEGCEVIGAAIAAIAAVELLAMHLMYQFMQRM
jgi:hypothetical protein